MDASARAVVDSAQSAVRRLPGGPVLSAAFRAPSPGAGHLPHGTRPEGPSGSVEPAAESGARGVDELLSRNAEMNLYYLELQERISAESRAYTALSNVLKTRHDTVKNAIGNIR